MSTYREATHHARAGGTARRGQQEIRFLTREEAEPILLATRPDRVVVNGKVKEIAPPNYRLQNMGLYDVSQTPPIEFRPTEEDIAADWVRVGIDDVPEPVAPEAVDAALAEAPEAMRDPFAATEPPAIMLDDDL